MLQEYGTLPNLKLVERQKLPSSSAIYFAIASEQVLYVGQARNLNDRWRNHHRCPQLEAVNKRSEVRLYWLDCYPDILNDLERQYIEHYCPTLNQTKVPQRQIVPSFRMLTQSLQKLNRRIIGFGVCPASDRQLKILLLGYLADYREVRKATTNVRQSLQAITRKPNSLFRWSETLRRRDGAQWQTRCNGIEIRLVPWFEEWIGHNPSMYEVMEEQRFRIGWKDIPMTEYEAMRQEVRAMSFVDRWELAKNSPIGRRLFPLECGAHFIKVSSVDTLCLQEEQLRELLLRDSYLQQQYPTIQAITSDPVPTLGF